MKLLLDKIEDLDDFKWVGLKSGVKVTEVELYQDEAGRFWLNGAETTKGNRGNSYCTQIIERLIQSGFEVYFSSANKFEHDNHNCGDDYDTRYLAGPEYDGHKENGYSFVRSLIKRKVIPEDWYKNPFEDYENY